MTVLNYKSLWLFVFLVSCSTSAVQPVLEVDNSLSDCLEITNRGIQNKSGTLHMAAKLDSKQPIGYCGCKSAWVSYRTYMIENKEAHQINAGTFNSLDLDIDIIELVNLKDTKEDQSLKLSLGCAGSE